MSSSQEIRVLRGKSHVMLYHLQIYCGTGSHPEGGCWSGQSTCALPKIPPVLSFCSPPFLVRSTTGFLPSSITNVACFASYDSGHPTCSADILLDCSPTLVPSLSTRRDVSKSAWLVEAEADHPQSPLFILFVPNTRPAYRMTHAITHNHHHR